MTAVPLSGLLEQTVSALAVLCPVRFLAVAVLMAVETIVPRGLRPVGVARLGQP